MNSWETLENLTSANLLPIPRAENGFVNVYFCFVEVHMKIFIWRGFWNENF